MKNLLQIIALMFPTMWKSFHLSSKILFFILAFTIVTLYTVITSWVAIKATTLDAADSWWLDNYERVHAENDKLLREMSTSLKRIEEVTIENRDDVRYLNRHLIQKNK